MGEAGPLRVMNTHLEYYSRIQRMTQIAAAARPAGRRAPRRDAAGCAQRRSRLTLRRAGRAGLARDCGDFTANRQPGVATATAPISADVSAKKIAWRACYGEIPHQYGGAQRRRVAGSGLLLLFPSS